MAQEIYLTKDNNTKIFVNYINTNKSSTNIIFCCTPVFSVNNIKELYEMFGDFGYNVFAFDLSGIGKSIGDVSKTTPDSIIDDFNTVVTYIKTQNDKPIYLFGDTGTGGIIAQYYASSTNVIKGLAQYGAMIYQDISPLIKTPLFCAKILYGLLSLTGKLFPKIKLSFSIPQYTGFNAEKENALYKKMQEEYPGIFNLNINLLKSILWIVLSNSSQLKNPVSCPTVVFKALHDRYFKNEYIDKYYSTLTCTKKLIEIDDVHNSFFFYKDSIAKDVHQWFSNITKEE